MTKAYVSADRSKSVPRPQYFCNWGDWSTNGHRTKCFCAWRDQKFLRLARLKQKCPPTGFFSQLTRAKNKWPPTEAFLVPGVTKNFCEWRDRRTSVRRTKFNGDWLNRSKNGRRPKQKGPPTAFICNWGDWSTNDRRPEYFRAWLDRKFLLLARPKRKVPPTKVFPRLARAKHKWPPLEAFFVPGVTESFYDWRGRRTSVHQPKTFLWLAQTKHMWLLTYFLATGANDAKMNADWNIFESDATESFCDWRDRSLSVRRTKQNCPPTAIILQLSWPKYEWPLTEMFLRLTRPKLFATGETKAKVSDYRSFFGLGRAKYKWPPTEVFLRLRWPQHGWLTTEEFSRRAGQSIFATGVTEA